MVGFRNVLVHEYQCLDDILVDVIEHHLDDLITFSDYVMEHLRGNEHKKA